MYITRVKKTQKCGAMGGEYGRREEEKRERKKKGGDKEKGV